MAREYTLLGGDGVISVTANVAPQAVAEVSDERVRERNPVLACNMSSRVYSTCLQANAHPTTTHAYRNGAHNHNLLLFLLLLLLLFPFALHFLSSRLLFFLSLLQ
jgi:hypothetical protein